jgi:phosphoribosylformylglycinamidine cyclo-ligase
LGEALLEPHRSYFPSVWPLLEKDLIHAMAHITGGGIVDNLARILPEGLGANVAIHSWPRPPLFELLAEKTQAPDSELYRAFNMGIGMVLTVEASQTETVRKAVSDSGVEAWEIGEIVHRKGGYPFSR